MDKLGKLLTILFAAVVLAINPFGFPFINDQVALGVIWLLVLYFYRIRFYWSFAVGLGFLLLAFLSTAFGHPGYAERFCRYTFWLFSIGVLQRGIDVFQIGASRYETKRIQIKKNLTRGELLTVLLLLLPLLGIYHSWFGVKPLVGGDWIYLYPTNFHIMPPTGWTTDGMGTFYIPFLWTYPLQFLAALIAPVVGNNFAIVEKIVWFIPILVLSVVSVAVFIRAFGGTVIAVAFGIIFYLANTYTILLFSGGQLLFALGFALFPLVFTVVHWATRRNELWLKLLAGLAVALLGYTDPRIAFLFAIVAALYLVYAFLADNLGNLRETLKKYLSLAFWIYFIPVIAHLYWIIPTAITNTRYNLSPLTTGDAASFSFMTLANVFTAYQPHWPENIFGKVNEINPIFYAFPFIFFLAPFILRRPTTWFFIGIGLLSAFLTKGTNPPLGEVYSHLVTVLPGFQLFRDPSKFYVPLILAYTLLFSLVVERLFFSMRHVLADQPIAAVRRLSLAFVVVVALFMYAIAWPAFEKKMDGTLVGRTPSPQYQALANDTASDQTFYRTLWVPQKTGFAYQNNNHPLLNALDLATMEPFNELRKDDFHTFTYIDDPVTDEFLRMIGVRYLFLVAPEAQRFNNAEDFDGAKKAHEQLVADLENRPAYQRVDLVDDAVTFAVAEPLGHAYAADKVFWVYGSSQVYSTIKSLPDVSLLGSAFIRKQTLADIPIAPAQLWQAQITESNFSLDAQSLALTRSRFERTVDIFNTTIPPNVLRFPARIEGVDERRLGVMVRRFVDRTQDDELVYGRERDYVWQRASFVRNVTDPDLYEVILPAPPGNFNDAITDRIVIYPLDQIPDLSFMFRQRLSQPIVEVVTATPTHYELSVREATLPYMLIFSEGYNPGWRAEYPNQSALSLPVYNLMNGFIISAGGNYKVTLTFTPQRFIFPSALLSIIGTGTVIALLFVVVARQHRTVIRTFLRRFRR